MCRGCQTPSYYQPTGSELIEAAVRAAARNSEYASHGPDEFNKGARYGSRDVLQDLVEIYYKLSPEESVTKANELVREQLSRWWNQKACGGSD